MAITYSPQINISAQFSGQGAVDQAKQSLSALSGAAKDNATIFGTLGTAVKGFIAAYAAKEIIDTVSSIIDLGDQLEKMSEKTGIGVDALSALKGAAEASGVAFDSIQSPLQKFSVNLAKAASGNQQALSGFKSLGISFSQLKTEDPGQLLLDVADKFEQMKDGPAKAAIAVALFGKSGSDIIPILNQGSAAIEKFGLALPTDFTQRATQFKESIAELKIGFQQIGIDIVSQFLPALNDVVKAFTDLTSGGAADSTKNFFSVIGDVIRGVAIAAVILFETFSVGFQAVGTYISDTVDFFKAFGNELSDLYHLASAFTYALTFNPSKAKAAFSEYLDSAKADLQTFYSAADKHTSDFVNDIKKDFAAASNAVSDLLNPSSLPERKKRTNVGNYEDPGLKSELDTIEKLKAARAELAQQDALEFSDPDKTDPAYQKQLIALQDTLATKKAIAGFKLDSDKTEYENVASEITKMKQQMIDFHEQQKESFGEGAKEAFRQYADSAKDMAAQSKKLFTDMFTGMEDALVNFVKTGKFNFAQLANAIEDDLLHIAIRALLVQSMTGIGLGSLLGGLGPSAGAGVATAGGSASAGVAFAANGGVMTPNGMMDLQRYASGGIATSPQVAVFGEGSQNEAFVPLPDGRSIPVSMNGSTDSSGVSVQVNIYQDGSADQSVASTNDNGRQIGNLIAQAVRTQIVNEKRPGGLLS